MYQQKLDPRGSGLIMSRAAGYSPRPPYTPEGRCLLFTRDMPSHGHTPRYALRARHPETRLTPWHHPGTCPLPAIHPGYAPCPPDSLGMPPARQTARRMPNARPQCGRALGGGARTGQRMIDPNRNPSATAMAILINPGTRKGWLKTALPIWVVPVSSIWTAANRVG